jgi:hypothetical protein
MGKIKLIVSSYMFIYLCEEFQCNVLKTMKQKATLQYVEIEEQFQASTITGFSEMTH